MCDCYYHPCEKCGRVISIHIGDFSAERKEIHPFCHICSENLHYDKPYEKVFKDAITRVDQVEGATEKDIGKVVTIYCDNSSSYGVALN